MTFVEGGDSTSNSPHPVPHPGETNLFRRGMAPLETQSSCLRYDAKLELSVGRRVVGNGQSATLALRRLLAPRSEKCRSPFRSKIADEDRRGAGLRTFCFSHLTSPA